MPINEDDLKESFAKAESTWANMQGEIKSIENEQRAFLRKFPMHSLGLMKIDQYVLGKADNSKDSFCYWIEQRLNELGNIHGARADKFGIYYSKKKSKYIPTQKFGDSPDEAFKNVKNSIVDLLESVHNNRKDIVRIKNNLLSPMFKGKILYVYYPEIFLNIFADEHLNNFLDYLGIKYDSDDDETDKREKLLQYKQSNVITRKWSNHQYAQYLYDSFGYPNEKVSKPLQGIIEPSYPIIDRVKASMNTGLLADINTSNTIDNKTAIKGRRIRARDFERENKANAKAGKRGEIIVEREERDSLIRKHKTGLAKKVHIVSDDTSLGYDILSFEEDGSEKHIEVKSTKSKMSYDSLSSFIISNNELKKGKVMENYYIYLVYEVHTINPKIYMLANPFKTTNKVYMEPKDYRVSVQLNPPTSI